MKARLVDCKIAGAMITADGRGAFEEGDLVVQVSGNTFLRVREYVSDEVVGNPYSPEDWQAFQVDGQAILLKGEEPLSRGAVAWMLRASFSQRETAHDDLARCGALVQPLVFISRADGESDMMAILNHAVASNIRRQWAEQAMEHAKDLARVRNWGGCLASAEQAFALTPELDAAKMGLLVFAYEQAGRKARASGYLSAAARSKGDEFRTDVVRHRAAYEDRFVNPSVIATPGGEPKPWRKVQREHLESGQKALNRSTGRAA